MWPLPYTRPVYSLERPLGWSTLTPLKPVAFFSDRSSARPSASADASASSAVSGFGGSGPKPSASRTEVKMRAGGAEAIMGTGDRGMELEMMSRVSSVYVALTYIPVGGLC